MKVNIAVCGAGAVGGGVVTIIEEQKKLWAARGIEISVTKVSTPTLCCFVKKSNCLFFRFYAGIQTKSAILPFRLKQR